MYWIELILELTLLLVFIYETRLAFIRPLSAELLKKQNKLKIIAAPAGSLLLLTFIVSAFSDLHALIGVALLLAVIVLSSTLVARGFRSNRANSFALWLRNGLMLLIAVYDLVITPLISH